MLHLVFLSLLVLSLSEGRTLTRCELRDELMERLELPQSLQKNPQRALARVICEVEKYSYLDTNLVREFHRETVVVDKTTTPTAIPTNTTTSTAIPDTTTTTITTEIPITTASTSPQEPTTASTTTTTLTTPQTSMTSTIPDITTTAIPDTTTTDIPDTTTTAIPDTTTTDIPDTTTTDIPDTTTTAIPDTTTTSPLSAAPDASSTAAARRRRAAGLSGLSRQKRSIIETVSVGFYGIFQFSDQVYCESGYHASENSCSSDCFAFSDDDITDDIQCFVQSRRFWEVFRGASKSCKSRKTTDDFFKACDEGQESSSISRWRTWLSWSANSY